uniref:Anti-silencing function protein 1 n=1 Tax=Timspurckia oligopyrenoides TaxID=708627 RepID=A0A7S0ZH16_9RHOD|mmetsp:Transcript_4929/g.8563  ORF Transcript_4929/g.8563 Transcript_4929/m.8563 type:complete len:204 (+) Transcript_4929:73-684(+)
MAAVDIFNVNVLDNPALFMHPLSFEITYEVREPLIEDIEWKVVYVGSAEDESYDQELESVLLPADTMGRFGFVLQVDAPRVEKLPVDDILGVTVILLSCSYKEKEFIRVGYYVNNEYTDPELIENPPATPQIDKLYRNIGADQPRVTKFAHKFDFSSDETPVVEATLTENGATDFGLAQGNARAAPFGLTANDPREQLLAARI